MSIRKLSTFHNVPLLPIAEVPGRKLTIVSRFLTSPLLVRFILKHFGKHFELFVFGIEVG